MRSPDAAAPRAARGPRGRLVFGSSRDLRDDPLGLLLRARQEFGDVVRFRYFGPFAWHFFAHPADVDHILVTHDDNFPKGAFGRVLDLIIPNGLVSTDDAVWARQRRIIQPGFHATAIAGLGETVVAIAQEHLSQCVDAARQHGTVDMAQAFTRLSFDVAGRALLGSDLRGVMEVIDRYASLALERLNYRVLHPLSIVPYLPTPVTVRYHAAAAAADRAIAGVVASRRLRADGSHDLLAMLLSARDEDDQGFDDREVCDEVKTLLITGYETTAATLTWLMYSLARHPEMQERVRQEVRSVVGRRVPQVADLAALVYTRQVLSETLRLYPPAPWLGRQVRQESTINGYRVPRGAVVCVSPFVTHRHPDFWSSPEVFDADRFSPDQVGQRPRSAYFPFGVGPRFCVGQPFAMMEILLVAAVLISGHRFRLPGSREIRPRLRGTLQTESAVPMSIDEVAWPGNDHHPAGSDRVPA